VREGAGGIVVAPQFHAERNGVWTPHYGLLEVRAAGMELSPRSMAAAWNGRPRGRADALRPRICVFEVFGEALWGAQRRQGADRPRSAWAGHPFRGPAITDEVRQPSGWAIDVAQFHVITPTDLAPGRVELPSFRPAEHVKTVHQAPGHYPMQMTIARVSTPPTRAASARPTTVPSRLAVAYVPRRRTVVTRRFQVVASSAARRAARSARPKDDAILRGDVDEIEVDPGPGDLASQVGQHAGRSSTSTTTTSRSRLTATWEIASECLPASACGTRMWSSARSPGPTQWRPRCSRRHR
jgi:hypothetical protein